MGEKINIILETLDDKVLYFNENEVPVFQCSEDLKLVTFWHQQAWCLSFVSKSDEVIS